VEVMNIRNNVRDPEDRVIDERSEKQRKEKMMDKTVADSAFLRATLLHHYQIRGMIPSIHSCDRKSPKPFRQRRERVPRSGRD
jgi:hypothetical protein